jgi:tripartite-type tricarboxylate transporter receptor subunit TctC
MTADFGQTVLVDNRPGASTIVGTDIVAKSAPEATRWSWRRTTTP